MAKQIWANLAVENVELTRKFYKALGFKLNKGYDNGNELASFIIGDDKFVVHFFPAKAFQKAANNNIANANKATEILFTLSAASRKEVDKWVDKVTDAGGKIFMKPTEMEGWMYSCGFADLDGHRWNVLYRDKRKQSKK